MVLAAHIRRIRHHRIIALRQQHRLPQQRQQLPRRTLPNQIRLTQKALKLRLQRQQIRQPRRRHINQRPKGLGLRKQPHHITQQYQTRMIFAIAITQARLILRKQRQILLLPRLAQTQITPQGRQIHMTAVLQRQHIQPNITLKNLPVILPRQHHQRKTRQLPRTVINVQTKQIMLQNQLRNIPRAITTLGINRLQHLIGFHQNMPRPHRRIEYLNRLRCNLIRGNRGKLRLYLCRLLSRCNVIRHLLHQRRVWISLHPLPPNRVLHQILHNPIGGKQLRGGRNILALHHLADDLVFFVGNIKLIQPTNNLNVVPIFIRHTRHQIANQRISLGQVIRQQQLRLIRHRLKQKRHGLV